MGALKDRAAKAAGLRAFCLLLLALLLASVATSTSSEGTSSQTLFGQSASRLLESDFPDPAISYLMLDVSNGEVLARRWQGSDKPMAIGSLVKPFAALAYAEGHRGPNRRPLFPVLYCSGHKTCWYPRGHGRLDIVSAIAYSCNSYFDQLALQVQKDDAEAVMEQFHLAPVTNLPTDLVLSGLDQEWKNTPQAVASAYLTLYRLKDDPEAKPVLEGMRLSAIKGTGRGAGASLTTAGALVKTGTVPSPGHRYATDGLAVVLTPADSARVLLLVRLRHAVGAEAARTAGKMLADISRQNGPMP